MQFVNQNYIPYHAHIKQQSEAFERFGAKWTPTQIVLDPDGVERHRIEGFLPVDDFLAQLHMGLGQVGFGRNRFDEAQRHFHEAWSTHPKSFVAPEARYWEGVSAYKGSGDPQKLADTGTDLKKMYPKSEWARKASVWLPQKAAKEKPGQ